MIITVTDKKRNNLALHLYMYKGGFGDIEGGWVDSITEKKKEKI